MLLSRCGKNEKRQEAQQIIRHQSGLEKHVEVIIAPVFLGHKLADVLLCHALNKAVAFADTRCFLIRLSILPRKASDQNIIHK